MTRRTFLNNLTVFVLGLSAAGLSGCGRRSSLTRPEGSTYPREYPTPQATGQPATIPAVQEPRSEESEQSGPLGPLPPASAPRY